ncbi:uncharacterized protein LOC124266040 [Haliotis rubra]|uniref:uncharacterized protein LOC124266040 n=1 Tax=Haliotis rubra TaxID=36100 RepID=UPI001EE59CD5|nr:uncharacterized protein LOC124266040 [Haliotis rubra]
MGKPHIISTYEISGLRVCDLEMKSTIELPKVYSKENLPVSRNHIPQQDDVSKWPHLSDINLSKKKMEIQLLIGNNVPSAYTPQEVRTGPIHAPHATKTILGWVVWNLLRDSVTDVDSMQYANRIEVAAVTEEEEMKSINKMLKDSMNYDFPERTIDDRKEHSQEDLMFLNKVTQSLDFKGGHYTIGLPFRSDNVKLPNNSSQALQRLGNLKSKMKKDADFYSDYTDFMAKIIDKGYAEQVPSNEFYRGDGREWYIPHHGVYHPQKQKIRVVFDCSALHQGISLNNQLLQGPDLTNSLLGILLRFREERVAIMGDIEAMYYQVKVPKDDQDFLRFFWWPGGDLSKDPLTYRMTVHLFGAISSPTCANIALRQTAVDNEPSFPEEVTDLIQKTFYVDDFLKSTSTDEKAKALIQEVTWLCSNGGFHLNKWISNSHSVMNSVPIKERAKGTMDPSLDKDQLPSERALGVHWNVEEDTIRFDVNIKPKPETRRGILSVARSVFDPLGLLAPFTLTSRILLQNLCRLNINWDDDIGDKMKRKWQAWIEDLKLVSELEIPRCYKPPDFGEVSACDLHMFSDASDAGYGVAAYICITNCQDEIHCALVLGKSRVVPLKKITIPRLELTAAVLCTTKQSADKRT